MKKKVLLWVIKVAVIVGVYFLFMWWLPFVCGAFLWDLVDSEAVGWVGYYAVWAAYIGLAALFSRIGVEKRADVKKMKFVQKLKTPLVHILPAAVILLSVTVLPQTVAKAKRDAQKADESRMAWEYLEKADEIIDYQNGFFGFYNDGDLPFDRNTMYIDYDEMHLTLINGGAMDKTASPGSATFRPLERVDADPYEGEDILLECPLEAPGKRITFYMGEYQWQTKAIIVEMADGSFWEGQGGALSADYYLAKALNRVFETSEEVIEFDFGGPQTDFPIFARGLTTDTLFIDYGDRDDHSDAGATFFYMYDESEQYHFDSPSYKLESEMRSFEPAEVSELEKLNVCAELELEAPDKRLFIYCGSSDDSGDYLTKGLILATEEERYFTLRCGNELKHYSGDVAEQPDSSELPWKR